MDWGQHHRERAAGAVGPDGRRLALAAIGLNIHFGYTGLLNFGQVGFLAVGAYGVAISVDYYGWSLWVGLFVGLARRGGARPAARPSRRCGCAPTTWPSSPSPRARSSGSSCAPRPFASSPAARGHVRVRRRLLRPQPVQPGALRSPEQARRPPGAVPRAARRPARPARAADRALGDRAAAGGGGPVPRRRRAGRGRCAAFGEIVGPAGGGPGGGHDGSHRRHTTRSRTPTTTARAALAARRAVRGRPDRAAPLDDRVRQLPPPRRAAHRTAQRDRHRAAQGGGAERRSRNLPPRSWPSQAPRPAQRR